MLLRGATSQVLHGRAQYCHCRLVHPECYIWALAVCSQCSTAVREDRLQSRRMHCSCLMRPHAGAYLVYLKEGAP